MNFFREPRSLIWMVGKAKNHRWARWVAGAVYLYLYSYFYLYLILTLFTAGVQAQAIMPDPQDTLKQHFEAAGTFQRAGDQSQAVSEYRAFLGEALHRMANGDAQLGAFDVALPMFDEAVGFSPENSDLILDYAAACLTADRLAQARTLVEQAIKMVPGSPRAHLLFGRVLFHLEDYPGAKVQLEAALAKNSDFETGYLLGRTYLLLKTESQARVLFHEMAAGLGDTALIHIYFGRAYSENDYPEKAIAEYRQAIAKDPRAKGAHYYLALTYLGHNEEAGYAKAVPEFRAELAVDPDDFPSHYMLGYIALQQRNLGEAETELTRAVALRPQDVTSQLQLAKVYLDSNRLPESEAHLRTVIAMANDPLQDRHAISRGHYMLGQLLQRAGRREEGQKELQAFAEMDKQLRATQGISAEERNVNPDSLARHETRNHSEDDGAKSSSPEEAQKFAAFVKQLSPAIADAYNSLGVAAAGQNDFLAAAEHFRKAGNWNPLLEGVDRNLGMASFYADQYHVAAVSLERYLHAHPEDSIAGSTLGLSYFHLENYAKVIEVLHPNQPDIDKDARLSYAYAVSLVKTGHFAEGIERLKKLENLTPDSPQVQAALNEALEAQKTAQPQ